jgi:hypothetical protein
VTDVDLGDAVAVRADLPTGTVTFLFTDVEGSTKLLHELGAERHADALTEHRRAVRAACRAHEGVEVDTQGDAFFVAFPTAAGALAAAAEITNELTTGPIHVRMGVHTGTPLVTDEGYAGDDVHFAARVAASGHGGQIVVSAATAALVAPSGSEPGVFWVGLAALRDPALVTQTISRALGARDGLVEHIGERELLVLLDNLEQVIAAAPELSALLSACPNLTLIVTSRELLRVQGEVEFAVPPLAEPEAVALFCERAQIEPSEEIAELCVRLDSLPLAVELAAARTKALSPAQILERLSQRLDLLKGGRDADPRQQTLRATIEWSYELLSGDEKQLFRRLSVFAGGCTLEAAEAVAGAELDTLQSLVEKSLLRFSNERYPFLISHGHLAEVREWAEAALDARDRLTSRGLAETLVGGGEIARFAGDLSRAIELKEELASVQGDLQRPNWKAATLADLCEIALDQRDFAGARSYAEQSAAAGGGARAVLCFAELALRVGDLRSAESNGLAALADLEEGACNHACGLELLGETARRSGDEARAHDRFRDGLRSFAELGDGGGIADCLDGLSRLAAAGGDSGRAGRLCGAAQRLRETRGRRPMRTDVPLPDVPDSARDEGRALTLDEAVDYALGT